VPNALHCHIAAVILSDVKNDNGERHYNNRYIYWVFEQILALIHPEDERIRIFRNFCNYTSLHTT